MNRTFSKLGSIVASDWMRGLFVAVATGPLTIIYQSVTAKQFVFDWQSIVAVGVAGGLGYIIKNLSTGAGGQIFTNAAPAEKPKEGK